MEDVRVARLFSLARTGRMSRRQLLDTGLRLGLASPVILSLIEAAPRSVSAAPTGSHSVATVSSTAQEGSSGTFTVLLTAGTEDIDPHYSYSTLSSTVALAVYEMLLILKGDSTDEFEPMLAESWEVSEDQSTYTFKLFPDGSLSAARAPLCATQGIGGSRLAPRRGWSGARVRVSGGGAGDAAHRAAPPRAVGIGRRRRWRARREPPQRRAVAGQVQRGGKTG